MEQFSDCEGILFLSGNDSGDILSINYLLQNAATLYQSVYNFWKSRFSKRGNNIRLDHQD
jgi:hypothetical protein